MMSWDYVAAKQYDWVERMGWHNKTVLETIAHIGSEIGELAKEYIINGYCDSFSEELADIILRSLDLAYWQKILIADNFKTVVVTWNKRGHLEDILELTIDFSKLVNSVRNDSDNPDFKRYLITIILRAIEIADINNIDIENAVRKKMEINEQRGTRGRLL